MTMPTHRLSTDLKDLDRAVRDEDGDYLALVELVATQAADELDALCLIGLPPAELRGVAEAATSGELSVLCDRFDGIAQRCAFISGYLSKRYGGGCGDQGHEDGAKEAQKRQKAVRKALGFTYPEHGLYRA